MPLYEVIFITRVGSSLSLTNTLRSIASKAAEDGGVVRNMTNLGDRILCKKVQKEQGQPITRVGRYISMQMELNPKLKDMTLK